ncbi:phage head closure protein [Paracoccus aminophilus]|uniref:Phage head-tail adaptor n=1 Tax=Paracoccus aminophilus JCM 7686 TaxID=1367847 RepID=S5Y4A5_PARAH|nr:phage head closure protein [Paracoccus aminophilus]AGT08346.1 phage head-tail adaptor [Paracoccus aminophilus JCM 7686]AGT10545.1 phage head-tail adaptor [Paracoccus aminophilus JCM 7686]AGT10578.1 phage head-tail adaptor [Paracoccus aminophilus JCM 7686]
MTAGKLDRRIAFQSPIEGKDADGKVVQAWFDEFTLWAGVRYLKGGEAVMQARLAARAPVLIIIRRSSDAARITNAWRCLFDNEVYHVKELPRMTEDRAYLEFLAEAVITP